MSKKKNNDEDYKKERIYIHDFEDENKELENFIIEELEDEEYYDRIKDDIYYTHKQILEYVVENELELCEYMDLDSFEGFLFENNIIQ